MNDQNNNKVVVSGGIGFCNVLGIVFVVLKLCHVIESWSWWWVLAPFWIPAIFGIVVLIILAIALLVMYIRDNRE